MADDARENAGHDTDADAELDERELELERTRKLILERRNRFMAAALAGLGMTGGNACTRASVCLSMAAQQAGNGGSGSTAGAGSSGGGGPGPETCPGQPWRQPPCVCLTPPVAGSYYPPPFAGYPGVAGSNVVGGGAGAGVGGGTGGVGGVAGRPPTPCLSAPIDEDAGVESE